MAARPRTLPAAIAPVLVGSAAAYYVIYDPHNVACGPGATCATGALEGDPEFRVLAFLAALVGSIFIQVGTNLANDYSDAKRGADTVDRLGPVRVTSSGLVAPRRVLVATWIAFAVAVACGIYLATVAGPVILAIGVVSILAGVLYTGGPRPYGYAGLGELFVFLFFGLVAVNGSYYVQLEELDWLPLGLSISIGCLSTAILVVNNIRDIETDRRANKNTLAVRLGREGARRLYVALVAIAYLALPVTLLVSETEDSARWWAMLAYLSLPLAWRAADPVLNRADGPSLNAALARAGTALAVFGIGVTAGLVIAAEVATPA
jgi:1,4-dihydroxy-2-naphthoate octaprenyltransferase